MINMNLDRVVSEGVSLSFRSEIDEKGRKLKTKVSSILTAATGRKTKMQKAGTHRPFPG